MIPKYMKTNCSEVASERGSNPWVTSLVIMLRAHTITPEAPLPVWTFFEVRAEGKSPAISIIAGSMTPCGILANKIALPYKEPSKKSGSLAVDKATMRYTDITTTRHPGTNILHV